MNQHATAQPQKIASPANTSGHAGLLQRKCACGGMAGLTGQCAECDKERLTLQRHAVNRSSSPLVPPIVDEVLRSPGQSLDGSTRALMESRFDHDFSQVRIHNDAQAAESARTVNALAYTVGRDVVFGRGQYAPGTSRGDRLLAHELSHVVQQRGATSAGLPVVLDSPVHEQAADLGANAAMYGLAPAPTGSLPAIAVQLAPAAGTAVSQPAAKKPKAEQEQSFSGVDHAVGQDPESLLRLDTVTVIELGANDWCVGCVSMRQDLSELHAELTAKPQRVRFRVFSINQEAPENEEIAERVHKQKADTGVPLTFVYVERTLKASYYGYTQGVDYKEKIRDIYRSASSQGVYTGMKWGSIIGGAVGGIAGAITGGFIASKAGGDVLGAAFGAGLIGGAIGAAVGLGLGALFGALFSTDIGVEELSKERLEKVMAFNEGKITQKELDHSLSEDIVNFWADHREKYQLSIDQRRVLIKNLMEGFTGDYEERAILKIIENSTDAEILQIFSLSDSDAPNLLELEAEFQGEERDYLNKLLQRLRDRFPVNPPVQKTTGLLIDNTFVQNAMAEAFRNTHKQEPNKPPIKRECTGVFIEPKGGGNLEKEVKCEDETSAGTNKLAMEALVRRGKGFQIAGSFHTHPVTYPPQGRETPATYPPEGREAPSAKDISLFLQTPLQGREHYVVGPLVTYVILRDGSLRVLGNTADLLHVERIKPKPGQVSTLELG